MRFGLYLGEITTVPAEVVCTSTNPHLDLVLGTGGAIREAGGEAIQDECRRIVAGAREETGHPFLPPGTAVLTGAGRLPFRGIIHCVAIDAFHGSTPTIIAGCVRSALHQFARLEPPAGSIGFPILASGNGRYDSEASMTIMLDELLARPEPPRIVFFTRNPDQARIIAGVLTGRGLMNRSQG